MIPYKEGGSFTYTQVFPYKPEMNTSELVVAPIAYEAKEKVVLKKEEIKVKAKFVDLPSRDLAPGIIYTPTRIMIDQTTLIADHGYMKEVIISKEGVIYFKKNKFDLDLKFGINKTDPAKDALTELARLHQAGLETEEYRDRRLGITRRRRDPQRQPFRKPFQDRQHIHDRLVQEQVKEANKDNKDKKAVKAMVDAAGKDVTFVLNHHGPDWNGFLKNVQASNIKDKDKILNVINSAATQLKKEQEIRNMILIYPEIEEEHAASSQKGHHQGQLLRAEVHRCRTQPDGSEHSRKTEG